VKIALYLNRSVPNQLSQAFGVVDVWYADNTALQLGHGRAYDQCNLLPLRDDIGQERAVDGLQLLFSERQYLAPLCGCQRRVRLHIAVQVDAQRESSGAPEGRRPSGTEKRSFSGVPWSGGLERIGVAFFNEDD
jgi:hypothetical protein